MAKNKEQAQESSEQDTSVEEIRRARREAAEAKKSAKSADLDQREEFRKYFAKISGKLKLEKSMEQILWIHFKASGHAEKDKFEAGIKHFGYTL